MISISDVFIAGHALCLRNIISWSNEIRRHVSARTIFSYRTDTLSEGLCAVGGQRAAHSTLDHQLCLSSLSLTTSPRHRRARHHGAVHTHHHSFQLQSFIQPFP